MKLPFKKLFLMVICCFTITYSFSQSKKTKTVTFKVYGNCQMCKQTIEASLNEKAGIYYKKWNMDTQLMTVTYNPTKTSLKTIQRSIADVGYDNDYAKAKDEVYNGLRDCCKYERKK
jgi:mercuric ion binding protein